MTKRKVVLLDGGMGQELVRRGAAQDSPIWGAQVMIDSPDLVRQLHIDYLAAGAKVITLNTYSCTPERLANVGAEDQFVPLQARAFELAAQALDSAAISDARIAASLPPLVGSYQPDITPDYEVALATYRRIVAAQANNVDLFICETMSCIKEAKAAATAVAESGKTLWVALTVSDECTGALRNDESIADTYNAIASSVPQALLLNCSFPEAIDAAWPHMKELDIHTGAYANGFTSVETIGVGRGVAMLEARTDLGPAEYAQVAMNWVDNGASIIGGCCEISPEHIKHLATVLSDAEIEIVSRL